MPRLRLTLCLALLAFAMQGCADLLDWLEGKPQDEDPTGSVDQPPIQVPSGPHLYCITNIGRTLVTVSLADSAVLPETRRVLFADPVGPWFIGGTGYYISRVSSDGSGRNSLIAFDPKTIDELARVQFPPQSNPTTLEYLPAQDVIWVALKGSSFDDFANNGIVVLDAVTLEQIGALDLGELENWIEGEEVTSLDRFLRDGVRVYALATNWRNEVRDGWLLVLEPDEDGLPGAIVDAIALGANPQGAMVLDGEGELWVVNNGGYSEFGGGPGNVQALDTAQFDDGEPGDETTALLGDVDGDPTGVHRFDADTAWVTFHPDGDIRTVSLDTDSLDPDDPNLPKITGSLIATQDGRLFGGAGGFGHATLVEVSPSSGAQVAIYDLQSGNGGVDCAEYDVP